MYGCCSLGIWVDRHICKRMQSNCSGLVQAAQHLSFWSAEVVRGKLLPLLMQWDMCHPDAVSCTLPCQASIPVSACIFQDFVSHNHAHCCRRLLFCRALTVKKKKNAFSLQDMVQCCHLYVAEASSKHRLRQPQWHSVCLQAQRVQSAALRSLQFWLMVHHAHLLDCQKP